MKPKDRERLINLLGMTGSDQDGEALNAMRMANVLVKKLGLTWDKVVGASPAGETVNKLRPRAKPEHQQKAEEILDAAEDRDLSDRERGFVEDMMSWNRPTEAQLSWLNTIHRRFYS